MSGYLPKTDKINAMDSGSHEKSQAQASSDPTLSLGFKEKLLEKISDLQGEIHRLRFVEDKSMASSAPTAVNQNQLVQAFQHLTVQHKNLKDQFPHAVQKAVSEQLQKMKGDYEKITLANYRLEEEIKRLRDTEKARQQQIAAYDASNAEFSRSANHFKQMAHQLNQQFAKYRCDAEPQLKRIPHLEADVTSLRHEVATTTKRFQSEAQILKESYEARVIELNVQVETQIKEILTFKNRYEAQAQELQRLNEIDEVKSKELNQTKKKYEEAVQKIQNIELELEETRIQIKNFESLKVELDSERKKLRSALLANESLQNLYSDVTTQMAIEKSRWESQLDQVTRRFEAETIRANHFEADVAKAHRCIEELHEEHEAFRVEASRKAHDQAEQIEVLAALKQEVFVKNVEIDGLKQQVDQVQAEVHTLKSENDQLKGVIENYKSGELTSSTNLADKKAEVDAMAEELKAKESYLYEKDKWFRSFAAEMSLLKTEVVEKAKLLGRELELASKAHPLKDVLEFTTYELSKVEVQLRTTPALAPDRSRLEAMFKQLVEQRDFLTNVIQATQQRFKDHERAIQAVLDHQSLGLVPPPIRVLKRKA